MRSFPGRVPFPGRCLSPGRCPGLMLGRAFGAHDSVFVECPPIHRRQMPTHHGGQTGRTNTDRGNALGLPVSQPQP